MCLNQCYEALWMKKSDAKSNCFPTPSSHQNSHALRSCPHAAVFRVPYGLEMQQSWKQPTARAEGVRVRRKHSRKKIAAKSRRALLEYCYKIKNKIASVRVLSSNDSSCPSVGEGDRLVLRTIEIIGFLSSAVGRTAMALDFAQLPC